MSSARKPKLYNFVVLPARGVFPAEGEAANAAQIVRELVRQAGQLHSVEALSSSLGRFVDKDGSEAIRYLWDRARTKAFDLVVSSEIIDGGPLAIRATAETERFLRSSGLRVHRQQIYRLIAPTEMTVLTDGIQQGDSRRDFRSALYLEGSSRTQGPLGTGVTVGVVDTGVDSSHPALAHAVKGGRSFVDGESRTDWGPSRGNVGWHGTHCAGIIAARDPSGRCPEGIAPEASVRSYRVFGGSSGNRVATIGVINAILAAVDDGCDIVNLSLGGRSLREDGVRDAINYAWDSGVVCIAAAGNSGGPVSYPAAHHNCVGISALGKQSLIPPGSPDAVTVSGVRSTFDPDVFLASFSNFGPQIDFAGPGVAIISTLPENGIGAASGTSMAAPAVSAQTAVVLSRTNTILTASRNQDRAAAIFAMMIGVARPYGFGSLDYEGYGVPV